MKVPAAVPFLLLACVVSGVSFAQTVYRSIEGGVTTFSDTPPTDGSAEVIDLDVQPPAEDGLLESRLAQMRETTDRMAEDRREREQRRERLRDTRARAPEPAPAIAPSSTWAGGYWPALGRPAYRLYPPFRPRLPHAPHVPAEVPPGWSVLKPGNAQLMRPIVSSRE